MSENKVILYEKNGFRGLSLELTSSEINLAKQNFACAASSLRVIGQPWVAYNDINFQGDNHVYEEGSYSSIDLNNIISMMLISASLENPAIKLFEGPNFTGKSLVVKEAAILDYGMLEFGAFSWQVLSGAWKMCDEIMDNPKYRVSKVGDYVKHSTDIGLQHSVRVLHPLKHGKPKYTANIQWDRKEELSSKVSQLDELIAVNKSKFAQKFTHRSGREYTSSIDLEMNFSSETKIQFGSKIIIPLSAELSSKLSNTMSFKKGKTERTTSTVTSSVSIPVIVPARTKVTIRVLRKDVAYTVPVEIVIERNKITKTEYATLVCRDGTDVHVSRHDELFS
ncbi:epidermal differentiation-specific protein-like [Bombina bombina]|uniref:epidermal differentiation-specific protein-like n=1 Tax=Bombina bombina TaxID=8345 RepID=UPI00235B1819|nr:epidermal differentiation-specific protein-like [Bombina bombina]